MALPAAVLEDVGALAKSGVIQHQPEDPLSKPLTARLKDRRLVGALAKRGVARLRAPIAGALLSSFLRARLGDRLSPRELWQLERRCLVAIRESTLALTVRRGARIDAATERRIGASRHPIDAWEYLLMFRLRNALHRTGLKAGAWGNEQARGDGEGLLFELTRLCGRLAGLRVPRNLDRTRRVAAAIKRPSHLTPVRGN
jgi:hypothetical protein